MIPTRITLSLTALALAAALAGCSRNVTAPVASNGSATAAALASEDATVLALARGATTFDAVLANIKIAFEKGGDRGQRLYLASLCDSTGVSTPSFHAWNDSVVLDAWAREIGTLPLNPTDLAVERLFFAYFTRLAPHARTVFTWGADVYSPADVVDQPAGTATLYRLYRVDVLQPRKASPRTIAIGHAQLDLVRLGKRWQVRNWIDHVDPSVGFPSTHGDRVPLGWRRLQALQSN